MGDVTQFPGGRRPPTLPPLGDVWDVRTRALDEGYVLDVLRTKLPADALRHIAGLDLASIARAVLLEVDSVRHQRRLNPAYDEHRAGGELGALERMFMPPARVAEPAEPPEPPSCA